MSRMTRSLGAGCADPEAGAFIGFTTEPDSSQDEGADPPVLLQGYFCTCHSPLATYYKPLTTTFYIPHATKTDYYEKFAII